MIKISAVASRERSNLVKFECLLETSVSLSGLNANRKQVSAACSYKEKSHD